MQTIENYLLNTKTSKLRADNTYISDGNILVKKDNLDNELLKIYCTQKENLMTYIPFERGNDYKLPNHVYLYPKHKLYFEIDEEFSVDYQFIKVFMENFEDLTFTIVDMYINNDLLKIVKVWQGGDIFIGCIACAKTFGILCPDAYFNWGMYVKEEVQA